MKKNNIKKTYLIALFSPVVILLLSFAINKIYPFGEKVILMMDGCGQYPGFLSHFINIIKGNSSLFYSLKGFIGFNIFANAGYYSLNITNFLYFFFKNNIINFYTFIVVFKMGLASLTMTIYLNYIKKNKYNFIFGICYGLSIYNILYYFNYMWFDSIIILPLVILGIEKIFKENKYLLYATTLILSIICNFYIGYMICIFCLLYFIYKSIIKGFKLKRTLYFIIVSLLAGLTCAAILIPTIIELLGGKGDYFNIYKKIFFKFDFDFISTFYKLTFASYSNNDLRYGTPNIYVSLLAYLNFILFFFNKKINTKEKIASAIIIAFFLLSMSFNLLDFFWQMFQRPIYYPVRYGFTFSLFVLLIAFKNFITSETFTRKRLLIAFLIIFILSIIGFFTSGNLLEKENITAKIIYLGISYLILFYYILINNNKNKTIMIIFFLIEISLSTIITFKNNGNEVYQKELEQNQTANLNALQKIKDNDIYRITMDKKSIKNNGLLHSYNDVNFFTSVSNKKTINVLKNIFDINIQDDCNANYYFQNPITNALLNIKYYVSNNKVDYYDVHDKTSSDLIYINNDAPSLGFITSKNLLNIKITDNYVNNINNIIKVINNDEQNIIKEITPSEKSINCYSDSFCILNQNIPSIKYEYKANKDEFIIIKNDYNSTNNDKTNYAVEINNKPVIGSTHSSYKIKKNDIIKVNITIAKDSKDYYYHLYSIDYNIYQKFIKNIKGEKMILENYQSDHHFTYKVTSKNDSLLFTSIANDPGWKIKIDNKVTNIENLFDGMIGINIPSGTHTIEFTYFPPGLKIGLIISISSLLGLTIFLVNKRWHT